MTLLASFRKIVILHFCVTFVSVGALLILQSHFYPATVDLKSLTSL